MFFFLLIFFCVLCIFAQGFTLKIQLLDQTIQLFAGFTRFFESKTLKTFILVTFASENAIKPMFFHHFHFLGGAKTLVSSIVSWIVSSFVSSIVVHRLFIFLKHCKGPYTTFNSLWEGPIALCFAYRLCLYPPLILECFPARVTLQPVRSRVRCRPFAYFLFSGADAPWFGSGGSLGS